MIPGGFIIPIREVPEKETKGTVWEGLRRAPPVEESPVVIHDVIKPAACNLAAGASLDANLEGVFRVLKLMVDVAPDVVCDVYLDDVLRFTTKDKLGLGGQFDLGDAAGKTVFRLRKVRVVATNTHATASRDVRAWLVARP